MELEFAICLPAWTREVLSVSRAIVTEEDRMRFVIGLSRRNIEEKTGGPFAAAVFETGTNQLVSIGVNLVQSSGYSIAHAEIAALSLAQKAIGSVCLKGYTLYSSCQPCAMCLGAVPWSGISELGCGATEKDARGIGFDEGDKPANWAALLEKRGIRVKGEILRSEAKDVFRAYHEMGGIIY